MKVELLKSVHQRGRYKAISTRLVLLLSLYINIIAYTNGKQNGLYLKPAASTTAKL